MTGYAENTEVPVERSKVELERMLRRAGASQYGTATDEAAGHALVYFKLGNRSIRLHVPLPDANLFPDPTKRDWEQKVKGPPGWNGRTVEARKRWVDERRERACRSRWRGLVLIVKAKLHLISLGLSTIEREFLADITLPDGRSVAELMRPALEAAYRTGNLPALGAHEEVIHGEVVDG